MQDKKNRPTPRRQPLKQTTVDTAIMGVFDGCLQIHLARRDWVQVERDFLWLGHYMENKG